ncbi:ARPP-2 domain-containing protein [Streptomyces boninensis]|uniref:ARPP-2 domain-containing protein n=1 Tax=Streptomyces boninensis TaxID=2039455 RepID=UPI003B20F7FC
MTDHDRDLAHHLDLARSGLTTGPAQVWGAIRLMPLLRAQPIDDLRLYPVIYGGPGVVDVGDGTVYTGYIPHGLIADWTTDGTPAAAYGTQLADRVGPPEAMRLHFHRRMARRATKTRVRFLPLHLAMEGYLALHFGGPTILWEEWSRRAVARGLSPRAERTYAGDQIPDLEDALRIFEIHPGQCGVLVYAADALAAAFAVPHPDDYRLLHPTLVQDMFGELIYHYAHFVGPVRDFTARIDEGAIDSLAQLRAAAERQQSEWADFHDGMMAAGLLGGGTGTGTGYSFEQVRRMGRFRLQRFLPPFERQTEQHIGETITDTDGRIAYLKTFRLSENQVRRGHLLTSLAAHDWRIDATAAALGATPEELSSRVHRLGFGSLLVRDR